MLGCNFDLNSREVLVFSTVGLSSPKLIINYSDGFIQCSIEPTWWQVVSCGDLFYWQRAFSSWALGLSVLDLTTEFIPDLLKQIYIQAERGPRHDANLMSKEFFLLFYYCSCIFMIMHQHIYLGRKEEQYATEHCLNMYLERCCCIMKFLGMLLLLVE